MYYKIYQLVEANLFNTLAPMCLSLPLEERGRNAILTSLHLIKSTFLPSIIG